jgi:zinc transport system permease protein
MIDDFILSWELFREAYLAGWLIGVMLSLIGVAVVARDQIFIGAAISQASTLGIAVAMWLGATVAVGHDYFWMQSDLFSSIMGAMFSIVAAVLTARGSAKYGRESHEAITGWIFLLSASASILVVSHSPHGLEEIYRLQSSTIIGATEFDVKLFASLAVLSALTIAMFHRKLLLLLMDAPMAAAVGMNVKAWSFAIAAWLGLAIGLSIRSSGMLYTFGCLILPALIAKNLCREVTPMFIFAPGISITTGIVAFVLANHYDYPPAQLAVGVLCAALAAAWFIARVRRR